MTWVETGSPTAKTSRCDGFVFDDFTPKHDDLGALRGDAQRRAEGRVRGLGADPRQTDCVGPGKAQLEGTVMGRVTRQQLREPAEHQRARRTEVDVVPSRSKSSHHRMVTRRRNRGLPKTPIE